MKFLLLLIVVSVFLTSCEFFETKEDCNPICKTWESCNDEGHCVLKDIACTEAKDCPEAMPVCDILNHLCIEDDNTECYANDECLDLEKPICDKGICIKKPDECTTNTDCTNSKKPICDNGQCVEEACIPNCDNRECGDNGCDGVCGTCGANQACNSHHQCVNNCTPKTCTELSADCGSIDNGCGTSIDCGDCLATQSCDSNKCIDNPNNSFNGSFENWTDTNLDDWIIFSQLILEKEESNIYDLATSVKLTRDANANDNALTALESIAIPVTEGKIYTLSSYVLDNVNTVRIRINYMWLDTNGDKIGTSVYGGYSSDSPNWENLTKETNAAPVGAVSIKIFFRVYNDGAGGNTGSVYLDDVTITEN